MLDTTSRLDAATDLFCNQPTDCGNAVPTTVEPEAASDDHRIKNVERGAFDENEDDHCWSVPAQDRIECSATNDDTVEIEQLNPTDLDDNVIIHVARSNAVRLARSILFAAGFKTVLIATRDGGGYCDVDDGDLPENFPGRRS